MLSVVVPTIGRPSLKDLLERLGEQLPSEGAELIVVDDGRARLGPAAARNVGWREAKGDWVVFLDDDVLPAKTWWQDLQDDLDQPEGVAGVQGRIIVPADDHTDWAANTAQLAQAPWITADMAYRRAALEAVGGFDERFPRAYREDAELAFRVSQAAGDLVVGRRATVHPVRAESRWISLRSQRGNGDDALLRRLYGPGWHELLRVPHGRRRMHALTTALALTALATPRYRTLTLAAWAAATTEFTLARRRKAPSEPLPSLIATSVLIPPLAVGHWLRGWFRHRQARRFA